jgi:hypothetical protein
MSLNFDKAGGTGMSDNIGVRKGLVKNDSFIKNTVQMVGRTGAAGANPEPWKVNGVGAGSNQLSIKKQLRTITVIAPGQVHPYVRLYHQVIES